MDRRSMVTGVVRRTGSPVRDLIVAGCSRSIIESPEVLGWTVIAVPEDDGISDTYELECVGATTAVAEAPVAVVSRTGPSAW